MDKRIHAGIVIGIGVLALFYFLGGMDAATEYFTPDTSGDIFSCQENNECAYFSNAQVKLDCVSANCPPPEDNQPRAGDPSYEWIVRYEGDCYNQNAFEQTNDQNESFVLDERGAECVCSTIQQCEISSAAINE